MGDVATEGGRIVIERSPFDALPDYTGAPAPQPSRGQDAPPDTPQSFSKDNGGDPWATLPDYTGAPTVSKTPDVRQIGSGEAMVRGAAHGLSFGTGPALEGLDAAANPDIEAAAKKFGIDPETAKNFIDHLSSVIPTLKTAYGAGRLAVDALSGGNTPTPAQAAYGKTRQEAADTDALASEQHPILYGGAELAGSLAAPIPGAGAMAPAKFAGRIGQGMLGGAVGGGLFGAGEAIGQGKPASDVVQAAGKGVAVGGLLGGVAGGVLGPRIKTALSPGERAVQTSHDLGRPLPKALSYDSKSAQAAGQLARQTPITGHQIDEAGQRTLKAAEGKIQSMAEELSPDVSRSGTDTAVRGSIDDAIKFNKQAQTGLYDTVRSAINPDQRVPLPNTLKALKEIEYRRKASGASPSQARAGLEEAWELAEHPQGGGFSGTHRRRALMRSSPTPAKPNPGYDKGDYGYVEQAMTRDLHGVVRKTATNPTEAHRLFVDAEKNFGVLAAENKLLQKIRDAPAEGGINKILNSVKEKGGFLRQLAIVKKSMPPQDFERISGLVMSELGNNRAGEFTFAELANQWARMSDPAKDLLFNREHRRWLDNIIQLAGHVKNADKLRNTSNTAGAMIMFDMLRAAGELAIAYGAGVMSHREMATTVAGAGLGLAFGKFMASPAKAASMSRWVSAYRGVSLNQPTPVRIAAFRIATRNLANNVNIPMGTLTDIIEHRLGRSGADPQEQQNN